jgi:hypothetical protein
MKNMSLRRIRQINRLDRDKRLDSGSEKPLVTTWIAKINNRWRIGGNGSRLLK